MSFIYLNYYFFFEALRVESRASSVPGKHSITKQHIQSSLYFEAWSHEVRAAPKDDIFLMVQIL